MRLKLSLILIALVLLSNCAGVAPEAPKVHCPALKNYTKADESKVGNLLADPRLDETAAAWLVDYIALRNGCRAQ